ncbi:hypothetical protein PAPYR_3089 [Paratrimastix pyriformis]|uniref:Uncharacterized protein n=1 Tax=Paratrimastix pyriformis TaxID=342808 RepID=A0ABQ8URW2_9EUKA|nr:hypothetical protein PAPYR_3089 [Paratrimastix pyriformis]
MEEKACEPDHEAHLSLDDLADITRRAQSNDIQPCYDAIPSLIMMVKEPDFDHPARLLRALECTRALCAHNPLMYTLKNFGAIPHLTRLLDRIDNYERRWSPAVGGTASEHDPDPASLRDLADECLTSIFENTKRPSRSQFAFCAHPPMCRCGYCMLPHESERVCRFSRPSFPPECGQLGAGGDQLVLCHLSKASAPDCRLFFDPRTYRFSRMPLTQPGEMPQEGASSSRLDISIYDPPTRSEIVGGEIASALWPSEIVLSRMLWDGGAGLLEGCTVLELGAGHGLAGITCASLGATRVCMTDFNFASLQHLRWNIDRNLHDPCPITTIPSGARPQPASDQTPAGVGRKTEVPTATADDDKGDEEGGHRRRVVEKISAICTCPTVGELAERSNEGHLTLQRLGAQSTPAVVTASFLDWANPPEEEEQQRPTEGMAPPAGNNDCGDPVDPLLKSRADIVVACDCIYERAHAALLMNVFKRYVKKDGLIICMGALSEHRYGMEEFDALLRSPDCPFVWTSFVLPGWLFNHESITGDVRAMRHGVWFLKFKPARFQ